MVDILHDVDDFRGLAGWLNINEGSINDIEFECKLRTFSSYYKCCMRELVERYCQEHDLNQTRFDIADALKKMKYYTNLATKLLQLNIAPGNQDCFSPASSGALLEYAKYLKDKYTKYRDSVPDKLLLTLGKEFVKLTLVKKSIDSPEAHRFIHLKSSGNVEQILEVAEEIEVKDIVKEGENTSLIVIEGEPGIGKSTLALEFCHQWQKGSLLQHFTLVVLLRLREKRVHTATTIRDLFFHDDEDIRDDVVKEVKRKAGEGVLFIFDGFDELPDAATETSLVMDIINLEYLNRATIIVTTRPSQLTDLQEQLASFSSKHIEIVGFTRESIKKAASNVLKDPNKFLSYLSAHPVVETMMRNPLTCAIVLNTYKKPKTERPIPHTRTQLYTDLTVSLVSGYLKKRGNKTLAKSLPKKLEDFPKKLYSQLLALGKLAYNASTIGSYHIFDNIPKKCSGLGLLIKYRSIISSPTETIHYSFLHKSLQEYITAFYVSQQKVELQKEYNYMQQQQTISKLFVAIRSDQFEVAKFVAGLTKMETFKLDTFIDSSCSTAECYFLILCFYEAQNLEKCELFERVKRVEFTYILTDYEMHALGYTISACQKTWDLVLLAATPSGLKFLSHGLKHFQPPKGTIHSLNLTTSYGIMNHENCLLEIPRLILQKITFLSLGSCKLNRKGFENLASSIPELTSLTALNVSDNPGGRVSIVRLMKSLKTHGKLKFLSMYNTMVNMRAQDLPGILKTIESFKSLHYIIAGYMKQTADFDTQLMDSLPPSKNISVCIVTKNILEAIYNLTHMMVYPVFHPLPLEQTLFILSPSAIEDVRVKSCGIPFTPRKKTI